MTEQTALGASTVGAAPDPSAAPRFEALWHTRRFLQSFDLMVKPQPKLRARIHRILDRYLEDLRPVQRSPLHNPKHTIYHTRVDGERRLVDEPLGPNLPSEVAVLYVGHHDDANGFGAKYDGDTFAALKTGVRVARALPLGDAPAAPSGPPAEGWAVEGRQGTYGEFLTAKKLRRLGVPEALVETVLTRYTQFMLSELELGEEVVDRVESSYFAALPSTAIAVPVPAVEPPDAVRVTRAELASLLRTPLHQFLSTLTEEQRALAERESRRLFVVKGAAGSGKTIVGIRRIEYLLKRRDAKDHRPILFTCYNRVLADAAVQMITATLGAPPSDLGVEVKTVYELFGQLYADLRLPSFGKPVSRESLVKVVATARAGTGAEGPGPLAKWSDGQLLDELLEIVFGRAITSETQYLAADRTGRVFPLDASGRAAVWRVFKDFRKRCRARHIGPWEQIPARLAVELSKRPVSTPRYFGMVIDEAQDLTPAMFRVLLAIQGGIDDDMMVLGDAAQNVYRSSFRWAHTGLKVTGRQVVTLRRSFRSTPSIVGAAMPLVGSQESRFADDLVIPEGHGDSGPPVIVRSYSSASEELQDIATMIAVQIEEGTPPSSIGVLLDSPSARRALQAYLAEFEVRAEDHVSEGGKGVILQSPRVKLLGIGSAKGLEFPVLFVPAVTSTRFPASGNDPESADRSRRLLYTAMTRSAWQLTLSAVRKAASSLLAELDEDFVVRMNPGEHSQTISP